MTGEKIYPYPVQRLTAFFLKMAMKAFLSFSSAETGLTSPTDPSITPRGWAWLFTLINAHRRNTPIGCVWGSVLVCRAAGGESREAINDSSTRRRDHGEE